MANGHRALEFINKIEAETGKQISDGLFDALVWIIDDAWKRGHDADSVERDNALNKLSVANEVILDLKSDAEAYRRMIPDLTAVECRNPISQVSFRAGLLACREYMARFVEQGGNPTIARSIRANWWPSLGDDPGAPRLFDFDEICEEKADGSGWVGKPITASVEALPHAWHFIATDEDRAVALIHTQEP